MAGGTHEFLLSVETAHAADSAELEQLTRNLRAELLDTRVADVRPVSEGAPPTGAKALDSLLWNTLRLFLDPAILGSILRTLTSWVRRNEGTTLRLLAGECEVELTGADVEPEAVQKMLETCLSAMTEKEAPGGDETLVENVPEPAAEDSPTGEEIPAVDNQEPATETDSAAASDSPPEPAGQGPEDTPGVP